MKDFFYGIQDLFVNGLFLPFDKLRALELESWFANVILDFYVDWFCCFYLLDDAIS
jgi:hypothetical protein